MLVRDSLNALHDFASRSGRDLTAADAETLVAVITDWYQSERATDPIDIDEDGDMLLFQWGSHNLGSSPVFYYDLTRQLIVNDSDDGVGWCSLITGAAPSNDAAVKNVQPGTHYANVEHHGATGTTGLTPHGA